MYKKICEICGQKMFRKKRSEAIRKNWRFCSKKCFGIAVGRKNKERKLPIKYNICKFCKKKFIVRLKKERNYKFCSLKCSLLFLNKSKEQRERVSKRVSGENCHFWKGGISPLYRRIRGSRQYKQWRKLVFQKNNYTCWICNEVGGELHPHHLKRFSEYPELRFNVNNGLTLCDFCHRTYTEFGQKRKNVGY